MSSAHTSTLPTPRALLRSAWQNFIPHLKITALWSFVTGFIGLVLFGLLFTLVAVIYAALMGVLGVEWSMSAFATSLQQQLPSWLWTTVGVSGVSILCVTIFDTFVRVGYAQIALHTGKTLSLGTILKQSWKQLWWLLPTIILAALVQTGSSIIIIPAIYLSVGFSFVLFVMLDEGVRGHMALSRTLDLIRGKWWSTFWRLVFPMLLLVLVWFGLGIFEEVITHLPGALQAGLLILVLATEIVLWLLVNGFIQHYLLELFRALQKQVPQRASKGYVPGWQTPVAVLGAVVYLAFFAVALVLAARVAPFLANLALLDTSSHNGTFELQLLNDLKEHTDVGERPLSGLREF